MVSKGFPNVTTSGRQYNIGEKPSVILYTYINLHAETPKPQSFYLRVLNYSVVLWSYTVLREIKWYAGFLIKKRVNVTTGYTLVKTPHSRVPTYLQRETDTADWSTPTFTLPGPKNGGVYPATSTFLQNCTPIFRNVP